MDVYGHWGEWGQLGRNKGCQEKAHHRQGWESPVYFRDVNLQYVYTFIDILVYVYTKSIGCDYESSEIEVEKE